jgi:hypothetical protein
MRGHEFLIEEPSEIKRILEAAKTIAVVGLSSKEDRPSHTVAETLLHHGYELIPVNPNEQEVLGKRAVPTLMNVDRPIDIVNIFRRSEFAGSHVDEAIRVGAKVVWLQEGVIDADAARRAYDAGLSVVMDHCIARELSVLSADPRPGMSAPPAD